MDDGEVGRLITSVNNIGNLISQEKYQQDDIDIELSKIANAISKIGEGSRQRGVRENPETLRALMFHLNNVIDQGQSLINFLTKFPQDETERTRKVIRAIGQNAQDKRLFLARKVDDLNRLRGR